MALCRRHLQPDGTADSSGWQIALRNQATDRPFRQLEYLGDLPDREPGSGTANNSSRSRGYRQREGLTSFEAPARPARNASIGHARRDVGSHLSP